MLIILDNTNLSKPETASAPSDENRLVPPNSDAESHDLLGNNIAADKFSFAGLSSPGIQPLTDDDSANRVMLFEHFWDGCSDPFSD